MVPFKRHAMRSMGKMIPLVVWYICNLSRDQRGQGQGLPNIRAQGGVLCDKWVVHVVKRDTPCQFLVQHQIVQAQCIPGIKHPFKLYGIIANAQDFMISSSAQLKRVSTALKIVYGFHWIKSRLDRFYANSHVATFSSTSEPSILVNKGILLGNFLFSTRISGLNEFQVLNIPFSCGITANAQDFMISSSSWLKRVGTALKTIFGFH